MSLYFKIAALTFFLLIANFTRSDNNGRQKGWEPYAEYYQLYDISSCLRELGIKKDDRVVVLPDNTPNLSLYLINQKGWTLTKKPWKFEIDKALKNNPSYLIINGTNYLGVKDLIEKDTKAVGKCGDVYVFRLLQSN